MSQKRTYPSGAEKRKRKKEEEEKKCRDKGALLKYFGGTEAAQWQSASSGSTVCNPSELAPPSCVPNVPSVSATTDDLPELTPPSCVPTVPSVSATTDDLPELTPPACVPTVPSVSATTDDLPATSTTTSTSHHGSSSAPPVDPAEWPSFLSDSDRTEQVIMGPLPIKESFSFPKRYDGRSFHYHYTNRQLVNGEKVKRSWLTYSRSKDAVYCFCCKLFSKKSIKLATDGQQDWVNIGALLKQHEKSEDHCSNMVKWKEVILRLSRKNH
ncbi:zinc finger MYM-type protein 5-like [Eriocheir sinensis]|uniref:zinc finger MYM-type protein 5-like n=1 Tax=Eriocheir sinensis TaxID=95602 RepID=UPI0021C6BA53|nr:zinc finger MYM-type protein 5-like [Eriocheir sinensis]